jgi:hypothetical protein
MNPTCQLLWWFFLFNFKFYFSTLDLLDIEFYNFFNFFMRLFYSYDLKHEFCRLIWLTWFIFYFCHCFHWIFFFSFSFNTRLIGIRFHNLFYILWSYANLVTQVWKINSGWLKIFFLINFFLILSFSIEFIRNWNLSTLIWQYYNYNFSKCFYLKKNSRRKKIKILIWNKKKIFSMVLLVSCRLQEVEI